MGMFDRIAEARIRDAVARGELDDLPGKGRPLALDPLDDVPPELRGAFLVCRNAGVLPEEMALRRDQLRLKDLIAACADGEDDTDLRRQLDALLAREAYLREERRRLTVPERYRGALRRRLGL